MRDPESAAVGWRAAAESLGRPYRVTVGMVVLVALVPCYIFIASWWIPGRTVHVPATAWDDRIPLRPTWALVYGALYCFLILLPVFVVRHEPLVRRAVRAYLAVWLGAYACFLAYPTAAPRPESVAGSGFAVWGLRVLYDADPPYNCFPSLHVAHSFVSALSCWRVHRPLGGVALACAALVALSTLFTRQHYVADVVAGALMAAAAYAVFLRGYPREQVPALDRRLAPLFARAIGGVAALGVAGFWVMYALRGGSP